MSDHECCGNEYLYRGQTRCECSCHDEDPPDDGDSLEGHCMCHDAAVCPDEIPGVVDDSLFDADELGLDPEEDDTRRYPNA